MTFCVVVGCGRYQCIAHALFTASIKHPFAFSMLSTFSALYMSSVHWNSRLMYKCTLACVDTYFEVSLLC